MSKKAFPKTMYVSAHDCFDDEGPFVPCTPDKEASVDQCGHGERVAIYELKEILLASKRYDLVRATAGRKPHA